MKIYNHEIVFREFPEETTLALNISNCPCHCKGCHSQYLAEDIGEELTCKLLDELITQNPGITCIGFMGGDADPSEVEWFAGHITYNYPKLRVGWYSGRDSLPEDFDASMFDYIKLGHYDESRGPLDSKTTNQQMFNISRVLKGNEVIVRSVTDITEVFWS